MVFISVRGRVWMEAEAANMVESVGNYVKHRKAPVIWTDGQGRYVTLLVPAISGESLAHAYQLELANVAKGLGLPVCGLCEKGYFLKSSNDKIIKSAFSVEAPEGKELEALIIKSCVVEDVGGFLYAESDKPPVKRTSLFSVGYMVPVKEALEASSFEPQMHSRYAQGLKKDLMEQGQMIYDVEVSSAVYTFSFDLDTSFIGKYAFTSDAYGKPVEGISEEERKKRVKAAIGALRNLLVELKFGAKRSRFSPESAWESLAIAVSDGYWTVPSPMTSKYLEEASVKLSKFNASTKLYVYSPNCGSLQGVSCAGSPYEAIDEALNHDEALV